MAKLDDFGRPIYETAEEYNKAHRGGVCPHGYDSSYGDSQENKTVNRQPRSRSAAQRHATVQNSKKAMKTVAVIGVFILALNIGVIVSMVRYTSGDEFEVNYEEEIQSYDEYLSDGTTPFPEGFDTFFYGEKEYGIPLEYKQISEMGFWLDEYSMTDYFPAGHEEMLALYDEDGNENIVIRINNGTQEDCLLGNCKVDYFEIINPMISDEAMITPGFSFGKGLSFESSYDEIEAYFGLPYYHYCDHSDNENKYDLYQWYYYKEADESSSESDEMHFVEIVFYNDWIESIGIEKKVVEEKY